ncbi:hypothetical protein RGQ29_017429 [Quercus rubra]|uniref:Polygalacturonase n=1 Tax=Quercus rubra TaxID=3512 RepID=A0AAN7J0W2_QUERU|nr:hypothetical protein RGQ29_017429 [Quercus rubra]
MGENLSIVTISLLLLLASTNAVQVFDIKSYGGQPNADITLAMTKAWTTACAVARSKVVFSAGTYKIGVVTLLGPCKEAPSDVASFKSKDFWVSFQHIDNLTVLGGGVFDGKGQTAWQKNNCNQEYNCKILPTHIRFDFLTNSIVRDIQSKDSKFFHINVLGCKSLQIQHVTITAPKNSPNTDGIHIGRSSSITITNANIGTSDDCISIGVTVNQVTCGLGHGISVGSLGRVIGGTLSSTENGVRIKTWPASPPGIASDIHFENIIMNNVANPILIDQGYCPNSQCSNKSPSKVKINNVSFKNIRGTSSTKEVVKLICSNGVPCQQVVVADIDLVYKGAGGSATSTCVNVKPAISGK